ncbi:MAG TPA: NHLP family bacteriocin export ABC transporter peptidase/permease/ATPase subunit [Longimicrobium sp.]
MSTPAGDVENGAAPARWSSLRARFRPTLPQGAAAGDGRRRRVPTILQMEALECGAASLAMVLARFRRFVPLEELRTACGVSRDGSKASNMLKAARGYGLDAKGFRKEPAQLRSMRMPVIVHWNFNHFVVVEGFRGDRVYLNDPAQGPYAVSAAEFDQAFTGVVLTFERTAAFAPGGSRRGILGTLLPRLAGSYLGLLFVVLAGLALVVPGIVAPTYARVFVDDVLVKGFGEWLRPLLILMGITAVVQAGLTWLQRRYLLRLETKLALTTSAAFFWHVLRLPVGFFAARHAGDIGSRVAISDRVARLLSGELATTLLSMLLIAFYAALMIQYDVVLTLVSVGVVAVNMAALKVVARRREELSQRLMQDQGKLVGAAMGGLQTIETLKATGSEQDFFARWAGYQAKVVNGGQQLTLTTHLLNSVPPLLQSINVAVILGVGGMRVMDGHLSMGMLVAFQALMLAFVAPVNRMVNLGGTLQEARGDLNHLDDVFGAERDPHATVDEVGEGEVVKLSGRLELRDVSFGYSPLDPPLIAGLTLSLRPGSRVALVGGSGCGKSTIARLVSGLYAPWGGEILFDGRPRSGVPRHVMANSVAVVDQEIFLFEGTFRDNLTLWDSSIPESDVLEAARDACIHEDIVARPDGYSSMLEEGGRNLSGGQRQRLEIARALAGNPAVLVLDEATSALDSQTEMTIDDNIRRRGCTCLIVAHRLSTIRDCDEIIVLARGRIVQRGTHEQLIAADGLYRRLIAAA